MPDIRRPYPWLILSLIVQAVLMTNRLDLLPMWNDELFTVRAARLPIGAMLQMVRGDVHPPLYFLLAHYWIRITPAGESLAQLRLLSVVFALLATIALDRLWLKEASARLHPSAYRDAAESPPRPPEFEASTCSYSRPRRGPHDRRA